MAVFRDDPEDYGRLDYEILLNGAINLYYQSQVLEEDVEWLKTHGYQLDEVDCSLWENADIALSAFVNEIKIPGFFGRSIDALNDCLSDIEIPEESGRVFIFHRYDLFAAKLPKMAWLILDIIEYNSRFLLLFGRRLIALVQSDDPNIRFENLGAHSARWNRREWINTNRGL